MLASHFGHYAVVKHLLENGTDIEAKAKGLTPLIHAIEQQHMVVVKLLLEKGAMMDYHYDSVSKPAYTEWMRVGMTANFRVLGLCRV